MKICHKCKEPKPLNEFYANKNTTDGYRNWCKTCWYENEKKYRKTPAGKMAREKQWRKYQQSARGKTIRNQNKRKYNEKYPEKTKAKLILKYATYKNKIIRQPCEVCGSIINIHGHHWDYSKPLDVMWLCREHHNILHQTLKRSMAI